MTRKFQDVFHLVTPSPCHRVILRTHVHRPISPSPCSDTSHTRIEPRRRIIIPRRRDPQAHDFPAAAYGSTSRLLALRHGDAPAHRCPAPGPSAPRLSHGI